MSPFFYDSFAVARILDVHVNTVRRMCTDGRLKGVIDVGGRYRIPAESLEAYITSVTVGQ